MTDHLLAAAARAFEAGRFGDAYAAAGRILDQRRDDLGALLVRAQAAFRLGRHAEASATFEAAAVAGAGELAWLNAASAAVQGGDAQRAVQLYRRALAASPANVRAWDALSRAAVLANDHASAFEALTQLALVRGSPEDWIRLATSLRNQDRFEEARFALSMVLLAAPHYLPARWEAMQLIPIARANADEDWVADERWLRELAWFEALADDDPHLRQHRRDLLDASTNFYVPTLPIDVRDAQRRYAALVARWARTEYAA